jgi:hypothetical protein
VVGYVLGCSMSGLSGLRLKGSSGVERRWREMTDRSMVLPDEGRMTGSVIKVDKIGSAYYVKNNLIFIYNK